MQVKATPDRRLRSKHGWVCDARYWGGNANVAPAIFLQRNHTNGTTNPYFGAVAPVGPDRWAGRE
jgi:hypothetical protein